MFIRACVSIKDRSEVIGGGGVFVYVRIVKIKFCLFEKMYTMAQ